MIALVNFRILKCREDSQGMCPLQARITVAGNRRGHTLKEILVPKNKWSQKTQQVSGSSDAAKTINTTMRKFKNRIETIEEDLVKKDITVTSELLIHGLKGNTFVRHNDKSILTAYNHQLSFIKKLYDLRLAPLSTLDIFKQVKVYLVGYLKSVHETDDLPLSKVDPAFVKNFGAYLEISVTKVLVGIRVYPVSYMIAAFNAVIKEAFGAHLSD